VLLLYLTHQVEGCLFPFGERPARFGVLEHFAGALAPVVIATLIVVDPQLHYPGLVVRPAVVALLVC
jgi:hypothetical protein